MSIADEILAFRQRPGSKCTFVQIFAGMDADEVVELKAALANPDLKHSEIHAWLKDARGFELSQMTVQRHRSRKCACVD